MSSANENNPIDVTGRPVVTTENQANSAVEKFAFVGSFILFLVFFPISIFVCLVVMLEFQRAVVFRLGRLRKGGPRGPGIFFILPCIDNIVSVDLRTVSIDVPPQEVLTKDSVTVTLDAVIYYRIHDPLRAVIQVANVMASTMLLAQTTLRNVAGTKMLMELLADKESISKAIEDILDVATDPWGVKVELVEIKDVRLPHSLQRAMAAEAEATREAKAKIVAAEGEFKASTALKQASDIIGMNPIALQLSQRNMARQRREVQYFTTSEKNAPSGIEQAVVFLSQILLILTLPLSIFLSLIVLSEYQRAVIFRCGRLRRGGPRGPGLVFRIPCVDFCVKVDLRTTSYDVPAQEILTRDHVTISLDAAVYYRIFDPLLAVIQVENVHLATRMLAQATLRNIAGQKHVLELMSEKDSVSMAMAALLKSASAPWGVYVERVEIKDVRLPLQLQRAMAAEAEAIREAKAKVVSAEGELNASKSLKAASDVIATNPVALQLRYLQTLSLISGDQNKNIIFPFPVNLIRQLLMGKSNEPSQGSSSKKIVSSNLKEEIEINREVDEALEEAYRVLDCKIVKLSQ